MKKVQREALGQDVNADEHFLEKVSSVLENSLDDHQPLIVPRLDAARHAAMLRVWQPEAREEAITQTLNDSAQQLPEEVVLRLDAIRQQAMARTQPHSDPKPHHWFARIWPPSGFAMPASAMAFSFLAVTAVILLSEQNQLETMPFVVTETELVPVSEQELELFDNLEFYQWLAESDASY